MSFLIDPPLLFLFGALVYFAGKKLEWNRHAKIVIGAATVSLFIAFSTLLYVDVFRCVFPVLCDGMTGSEFMFHTNYTGITKGDVPAIVAVALFLLYPLWIFLGYALALLISKRRRFTKETYSYRDVKSRIPRRPSEYAVVRDPDPRKCVREAVSSLGGIQNFVKEGDKVLIKVNICGGVPEIKGTFTSTEVAGEVVNMVRSAGGVPIIADADMIWTKFWPAATDEGWVEWAKNKGVKLVNLSETRIVNFDFGENSALGVEKVSRETINADVIVSISAMKTHLLTGVTLGMKNMYGTFPEVDKAKYHRKKIEDVIYEVNKAFTPNLVIIDGSIGGETVGPLSCQPVNFQTIVASNDVVTADAVACQLMGYNPMDITHIRMAHERGLGDASRKYDLRELPYRHVGGRDGNWNRPEPEVKDFYEWGIEFLLKFPGWGTLFNIGADFFLYDLARLPVFKYFTPAALQMLNGIFYMTLKGEKATEEAKKRRRTNLSIVLLVIMASLLGFYMDGYFGRSSLFFKLNYLAVVAFSLWVATRMKTKHLIALAVSTVLVASTVEYINPSAGLLVYYGGATPPLFAVFGWVLLMISILGFSNFLWAWLLKLGLFLKLRSTRLWRNLPLLAALLFFTIFLRWEGYFEVADKRVYLMYVGMALVGFLYSSKQPIEWNASLMAVSIVLGGYMEFIGSSAGLWHYHYMEPLPIFITITWAINTWAVHGLSSLLNIDLARSMAVEVEG